MLKSGDPEGSPQIDYPPQTIHHGGAGGMAQPVTRVTLKAGGAESDSLKLTFKKKMGVVHLNSQYGKDRQIRGTHPVWSTW